MQKSVTLKTLSHTERNIKKWKTNNESRADYPNISFLLIDNKKN